jgi:hypothetical protein
MGIFSQNKRKPFRCQATTVSALTMIRADFQSAHTRRRQTQKIRSADVSFSRCGAERRSTASCCRKARFSSRSWAEVLTIEARASNPVDRVRHADQKSKWKSINFNDYRWIRILWRHNSAAIGLSVAKLITEDPFGPRHRGQCFRLPPEIYALLRRRDERHPRSEWNPLEF